MSAASQAVEATARESYGRLVAWLTHRCGDISLAEDAMADALESALRTWPERGIPDRPDAWLLTTARRKVIDRVRRDQTRARAADQLRRDAEEAEAFPFRDGLPDRRLELLFLCAHPEVPANIRTPLILQTVLGLPAKRIAGAFLVPPATMGQRLVRAKRQLKDLRPGMDLPGKEQLRERLPHVLEAIYAAYACGWDARDDEQIGGLSLEALWLARLVVHGFPNEAEALGLLGLISFAQSRRQAQRGPAGEFIPLEEQDPALWDADLVLEGEKAVWIASKLGVPGRYQLEAAIQSVHAHRAVSGETNWSALNRMYGTLVNVSPSVGAVIGHAASFGRLDHPAEGLTILDRLEPGLVKNHQPYWAVRAHLLREAGRHEEAQESLRRAIGLTEDPAVRRWLMNQLAAV